MDAFSRAFSPLGDLYRSMTPSSRLTAGLLVAVAVGALSYLCTQQVARPDVDLMHGVPVAPSQLPVMQAAFAKAKLKSPVIRGTSIFVPRGEESQYMQALVAANALPPSLGAARREALNSASMMEIGSAREQYRMKMAKLEDLAATIRLRPGIEIASVDYDVDLRPGPFKDKVATAVVWVKAAGSAQLDEETILAIRDSVVPAFAGLTPENVTVSDLNGRTWRGAIGSPEENQYRAAKRDAEQQLKGKIAAALSHVPGADVQVNVEVDRRLAAGASTTPSERGHPSPALTSAKVLVRVPTSYFTSIWQNRNPAAPGQAQKMPDQAALDQIRAEESASIQRCVAATLPPMNGASLAETVTVTPFVEISTAPPTVSVADDALAWAAESWRPLAGVGIALICFVGLWWITRAGPAKAERPTTRAPVEPAVAAAVSTPAPIAAPHWRRPAKAADEPARDELSKMVEDNPEMAANILRKWIGQAS
jgi:flagellar biosynthesis/type III secretory pathway M-ring protein FliF/YscJ